MPSGVMVKPKDTKNGVEFWRSGFDAVISTFIDKQELPEGVDKSMIESTAYRWEGDGCDVTGCLQVQQ